MAKEPSGNPEPEKAEPPAHQNPSPEDISSPETAPEDAEQPELPLEISAPLESVTSPEGGASEEAKESSRPAGTGDADADRSDSEDADPHHDEYNDDHYGYHEGDEYHHGEHGEYHDPYHEEYHHDDQHGDPHHDDPHAYSSSHYGGGVPDDPDDDFSPEYDDDGNPYGGPVKPFLDHLEDFRWMLLKIFSSVAIGMVVSLVAAPNIMGILTKPMEWAREMEYIKLSRGLDKKFIPVRLGDKQITTLKGTSLLELYPESNKTHQNSIQELQLVLTNLPPIDGKTNQALTLVAKTTGNIDAPIPEAKYYGVIDPFMGAIKLAIFGGIFISIPFILYFVGDFILPALKSKERKLIYYIVGCGTLLFLAGAAFCYFVLLKITMLISVSFAHMLGFGADEWRADNLIGFVAKFTIGMGLAFQMPMIILSLVKIGFVDDRGLAKFRSYAIIINLILAAMITPTVDPFTMLMVAGPLQLLYEISLFIARLWRKREEAAEAAEETGEDREE